MAPDPPRVEAPLGLRQMYPPVTLKYPLVQKLIETPALFAFIFFPFNSGSTMVAASATGILEAGLLLLVARK